MTRNAAIVPLHPRVLEALLALKDQSTYIAHVEHDHTRGLVLVHLGGHDVPVAEDGTEPRLITWLADAVHRAALHPLGELIAALGTLPRPSQLDAADILTDIHALLSGDALGCLGLVEDRQPITENTRADLLVLAAQLVTLAGITLDAPLAADETAINQALDELAPE